MEFQTQIVQTTIVFLLILTGGVLFYSNIEGWRYLDSAYFVVATVTTVGYGDITPQTDLGKVFTIVFAFMGIGFAFFFFTLFGRHIYKKQLFSRLREMEKLNASQGIRVLKK